jgi:hypothetical protein
MDGQGSMVQVSMKQSSMKQGSMKQGSMKQGNEEFEKFLERSFARPESALPRLRAMARTPQASEDPCLVSPEARYRGTENHLYRVEVHHGSGEDNTQTPTFKWSRDNGAHIFPVVGGSSGEEASAGTTVLEIAYPGRDDRSDLSAGSWVELLDEGHVFEGNPGPMLQVLSFDRARRLVMLRPKDPQAPLGFDPEKSPILRRWEDQDREIKAVESAGIYTPLERGVEIQFVRQVWQDYPGEIYRTGDYWLIPARVATGDIEWPRAGSKPEALPARMLEHHYAPLAVVELQGGVLVISDLRRLFKPLAL